MEGLSKIVAIEERVLANLLERIYQLEQKLEKVINPIMNTLTESEAAKILKIHKKTLERKRRNGEISFVKAGAKKILYTTDQINEYLINNGFNQFQF